MPPTTRMRVWAMWLAALCTGVALLASATSASAGEVVYQHGSDLWVMNENGTNQRPFITAAQAGASTLTSPSLDPSSGDLSFDGTPAEGVCSSNCPGLYSYVGTNLLRLSPAASDCITPVFFVCGSSDGEPNATTANGRVIYEHAAFYEDSLGSIGSVSYEQRALDGSGEPSPWAFPSEPGAGEGGEGFDAVDPIEPNTIAYPSNPDCYEVHTDTGCQTGILIDHYGAAKPSYVVSYDDEPQQAMAFSPNGQYIADIEVGEERGIWVYTNEDINDPANEATWHAWWVLADPLQDSNDGGNPDQRTFDWVTITNTGEILFDEGVNIYELPASCWAPNKGFTLTSTLSEGPTCGTFGQPGSQAVQLTTEGTTNARDEHPTWTSAALTPYPPPSAPPSAPPSSTHSTLPTGPPAVVSPLAGVALASSSVVSGKSLTFKVTLKSASKIKVEILRFVPASGHGTHRHKAHYVPVETLTFNGKVGLNKLAVSTKHDGHKLAPGKYEAKILAGTGSHVVSFTIKG
jgi:hypothetical protein